MATSKSQNDQITTEIPTNSIPTKPSPQKQIVTTSILFLLCNICNLVPLCLDSTNFILWKYQVSSILKAHSLFSHIDDSLPALQNSYLHQLLKPIQNIFNGSYMTKPSSPS
uniref:Uncharacterized protein n=1 Tax=Cucumis melo TaxID=3656 RepID=A0A9I9EH89_CUCME